MLLSKGGIANIVLKPSHVVLTGASSGLGRALAEHYAADGVILSLCGRDPQRLADTAARCEAKGARVAWRSLDVTDQHSVSGWLQACDQLAPVDLLFVNAGIGGDTVMVGPSGEDARLAQQIVGVNLLGVVHAVTAVLPGMVARRRGAIVLIGSISGELGLPHSPLYCATKAAVRIYGDALRRLTRSSGVKITTVLPGFIDTPMSRSLNVARPWCWPADVAARRIARDVARAARRSVFPWQLRLALAAQAMLPAAVTDRVLSANFVRQQRRAPTEPAS